MMQEYLQRAQTAQQVILKVLENRGADPSLVNDWVLTPTRQQDVILFAVLDAQRIARPESYQGAVHHLSSALGGAPVYWSNSTGFRFAVQLSPRRKLPGRVDFPQNSQPGRVLLGQRYDGRLATLPWDKHFMVAGITGSGKSVTLRTMGYQALRDGQLLAIGDIDGTTFPMLAANENLYAPLARTHEDVLGLVESLLGEIEHRSALYDRARGFPENIDEYNAQADEPLRRILIILDEFNSTVAYSGGANGKLAKAATTLAARGRKFGLTLVLAAQEFGKDVIGNVRDQMAAMIAFRVRNADTARNMQCGAAVNIPEGKPGRAVTDRWGVIQAYYLDKTRLIGTPSQELPEFVYARRALAEQGGKLTLGTLMQWGLAERAARGLLERWELAGWLTKDTRQGNARVVTPKLAGLLSNAQSAQTRPKPVQTGAENVQTALDAVQS